MSSDSLPALIHRLSGVYRDPQRVLRDAETLLSSPLGSNLRPTTEPLMLNDGTCTPPVLMLTGTLPMTYRNVTYNLPIDMYLPPPYPLRPPTVFVRPVATMAIKENHRHVALDGTVYLPYLNEWRPTSHELRELAVWMSSLFGSDPPCYAKRTAGGGGGQQQHGATNNPPPYSQAATSSHLHTSSNTYSSSVHASTSTNNTQSTSSSASEQERRRKALEQEIDEANLAAETARRAAEEEERLEKVQKRLQEEHTHKLSNLRVMATSKAEFKIQQLFSQCKEEMKVELKDQKLLERGKATIERQLKEGAEKKALMEKENAEMDKMIDNLENWLAQVKAAEKEDQISNDSANNTNNGDSANGGAQQQQLQKIDLIALPADTHSAQMLALSAEINTIDDCIYFLDQALVRGSLTLDVFLKEVRKLSKRQFLAKAHLLKIAHTKSS